MPIETTEYDIDSAEYVDCKDDTCSSLLDTTPTTSTSTHTDESSTTSTGTHDKHGAGSHPTEKDRPRWYSKPLDSSNPSTNINGSGTFMLETGLGINITSLIDTYLPLATAGVSHATTTATTLIEEWVPASIDYVTTVPAIVAISKTASPIVNTMATTAWDVISTTAQVMPSLPPLPITIPPVPHVTVYDIDNMIKGTVTKAVTLESQVANYIPRPYSYLSMIALTIITTALLVYAIGVALGIYRRPWSRQGTYLLDVATFRDFRTEWVVHADMWCDRVRKWFQVDEENITFVRSILDRSGISQITHYPPSISTYPPDLSMAAARHEAEVVMYSCVDQLLQRNKVDPKDVDILVVNCSLFNPTPSLAAMVINNYKMREDIICYNLSGMGCSAGVIALDLASSLLKTHYKSDPIAIVISMENITQQGYFGKEKAMMLANALFRMGGAAIMLTRNEFGRNGRPDPKYRLNNLVRVHLGADSNAHTCVYQHEDTQGFIGVRLDKSLMRTAARALERNMTRLGPQILPLTEKVSMIIIY